MTENMGKWPSGNRRNRKIRSSSGCIVKIVPSKMVRGYYLHETGGYLGNVGLSMGFLLQVILHPVKDGLGVQHGQMANLHKIL